MPTAILVDGDFFLRRYRQLKGKAPPRVVAKDLHKMCLLHLSQNDRPQRRHTDDREHQHERIHRQRELYRIFFYDCPPLSKKVHNPITAKAIDFSKTATATWRLRCSRTRVSRQPDSGSQNTKMLAAPARPYS